MRLTFVVPDTWKKLSGGNLYNRQIVKHLRRLGHWVNCLAIADYDEKAADPVDLILVDSLLSGIWETYQKPTVPTLGMLHVPKSFLSAEEKPQTPPATCFQKIEEAFRAFKIDQYYLDALDGIICVSQETLAAIRSIFDFSGPALVLIPARRPEELDDRKTKHPRARLRSLTEIRILCVGRVDANKRQTLALQLIANFAAEFPFYPIHLTICGADHDHYYQRCVEPTITRLGLADSVTWIGEQASEKMPQVYENADVFLCSSRYESWGIAIMEAMNHGLLVLNCADGGAKELSRAACGLQIASQNDFNQAILRCFKQPEFLVNKANDAQQAFERIPSWDSQADRFCEWIAGEFKLT